MKHVLRPSADLKVGANVVQLVPVDVIHVPAGRITNKGLGDQDVHAVTAAFVLRPQ